MLSNLLSELKETTKPSEKINVLKKHDNKFFRWLINATYDPFKMYHIKFKKSEIPEPGDGHIELFEAHVKKLLAFCEKSMSPKQNREKVIEVLKYFDKGSQDLLLGVLEKNWKSGIGTKTILKVFPGIVPTFEVQLANTYNSDKNYKNNKWISSFKLDGLRCISLRQNGEWRCYSRKGHEFYTVEHIKKDLEKLYEIYGYTFYDGELYKHGLKFEEIQGPVMAFTAGQAEGVEYHIFVCGQAEDFLNGVDNMEMTMGINDTEWIKVVEQDIIETKEIYDTLEKAFELGYEGIMLKNPEKLYDFKRSDAIVKVKKGKDAESSEEIVSDCVVTGIVVDDFPVVLEVVKEPFDSMEEVEVRKVLETKTLLVKLWVLQQDGVSCKVGSGFDLPFRYKYTENPEEIIGKVVEIRHQKWGKNGRMRFPRLERIREDLSPEDIGINL